MLTQNEMAQIAYALFKTARKVAPFSDNLDKFYENKPPIYGEFCNAQSCKIVDIRSKFAHGDETYIPFMSAKKVARCEDLADLILDLSKNIAKIQNEKIYISKFSMSYHTFCVLHQDQELHEKILRKNFNIGTELFDLKNFINPVQSAYVVDAWVYKIARVDNLPDLVNFAEIEYQAGSFFENEPRYNFGTGTSTTKSPITGDCSVEIGMKSGKPSQEIRPLLDFYQHYYEVWDKKGIGTEYGIRYQRVANKLDKIISTHQKLQQSLKPLCDFFIKISNINRDTFMSEDQISCLNRSSHDFKDLVDLFEFPESSQLTKIAYSFFRVATLIQNSTLAKKIATMKWSAINCDSQYVNLPDTIDPLNFQMPSSGQHLLKQISTADSNFLVKFNLMPLKEILCSYSPPSKNYINLCSLLHKENIDFFILTHPQSKLTRPGHFMRSLLYSSNPQAHQSNMRWARSMHTHESHHHEAHFLRYLYSEAYAAFCYQQLRAAMKEIE